MITNESYPQSAVSKYIVNTIWFELHPFDIIFSKKYLHIRKSSKISINYNYNYNRRCDIFKNSFRFAFRWRKKILSFPPSPSPNQKGSNTLLNLKDDQHTTLVSFPPKINPFVVQRNTKEPSFTTDEMSRFYKRYDTTLFVGGIALLRPTSLRRDIPRAHDTEIVKQKDGLMSLSYSRSIRRSNI